MAYRIANDLDSGQATSKGANGGKIGTEGGDGASPGKMEEEEERDAVFYRLEILGYRVGQGLVER